MPGMLASEVPWRVTVLLSGETTVEVIAEAVQTDHAGEARKILSEALTMPDGSPVITELLVERELENQTAWVAEAQVHATLAVAQETRTTNRLLVALIDQLGEIATSMPPQTDYLRDTRIPLRTYLSKDDWNRLEEGIEQ